MYTDQWQWTCWVVYHCLNDTIPINVKNTVYNVENDHILHKISGYKTLECVKSYYDELVPSNPKLNLNAIFMLGIINHWNH